jgi:RNA polymerase sigma-70 factor, ECF subfamily
LCRRNTRGRCGGAEAEEAVQETFIRAFRNLAQLDDASRFRPWLYAIASRVCSEKRRAAFRRAKHEENAVREAMLNQPACDGEAERAERAEQLQRLGQALDQLTEQERLAVHLHYLDETPAGAAMSALGVSRSGFYKLLSRAREKLAALLTPVEKEPVP